MRGRPVGLRAVCPLSSRADGDVYRELFRIVRGDQQAASCGELHALRVLAKIKADAELMTWRAIDDARAAGMGWEEIGQALGMTRQGAQAIYTRKLAGLSLAERMEGL